MIGPAALTIALAVSALGPEPDIEPEHAKNPIYQELLADGITLGGARVEFPAPILTDGMTADAERTALRKLAGSERAMEEFLRDSVAAPQILKVPDGPPGGDPLIRAAHLWFVVHADLDAIDPADAVGQEEEKGPREVGNMRFEWHVLPEQVLKGRKLDDPSSDEGRRGWYAHLSARLLDRIECEATNRTVSTRSRDSIVVAARQASAFDDDADYPNRWREIQKRGGRDEPGPPHPYAGGASFVKIGRLKSRPGALLVEAHFAFAEPKAWFDGRPILRSKIGLAAQDQIRALRRELARRRAGPGRG